MMYAKSKQVRRPIQGKPLKISEAERQLRAKQSESDKRIQRSLDAKRSKKLSKLPARGVRTRDNTKWVPKDQVGRTRTVVQEMTVAANTIPNQVQRVQISATFSLESYRLYFWGLCSYLAQKNVININKANQTQQWISVYNGLQYLMQVGAENFVGTTLAVNEVPRVVDHLYQALTPKQLKYDAGYISFGWKTFDPTSISISGGLSIFGHKYDTTYITSDAGGPAEFALLHGSSPDPEEYAKFLSIVSTLGANGMLKSVPAKTTTEMARDVSAFARVYSYVGNQAVPSLAGSWLDCELETKKLPAPFLSKFCVYQDSASATDPRLARSFMPYSLDSSSISGWPLHESFCGFYNKSPPKVNHVDMDQIFTVAALWMAKLKQKAATQGLVGASAPLSFSAQSFYLVLRNALMSVFDTQYFMQFQGNNQWFTNLNNAFLGFFVMAHCAGNPVFGRLTLPEILVENILALKAREYRPEGGKNPTVYLPVLGRYYRDTLPEINVLSADGTVIGPLFSVIPGEPVIDPIDCTSGGLFVNVQGTYYQNVMDDWAGAVDAYKQFSAPVQFVLGDGGPRGLLSGVATRILKSLEDPEGGRLPVLPAKISQSLNYCANKPYNPVKVNGVSQLVKKIASKGVELIPDASILSLATDTILSRFPVTQEMYELFDLIILPTDRTDESNDVLNQAMIQVMGLESYSYETSPTTFTVAGTGAGEWNRLNNYANELTTGLARGELTKFQQIFTKMITNGEGGVLASLLGGVAKGIFPGCEGIIDTISSIVPF